MFYRLVPGPVSKLSAVSNDSNSIYVSWVNSSSCVRKYDVVYCSRETFVCTTISTQVNNIKLAGYRLRTTV